MACKVLAIFIASLVMVSASVIPSVKVLQGPGSKTDLYGPDGSAVKSTAPGGTVVTDPDAPAGLVAAGPAILPASPQVVVGGGPVGKIVTSWTLAGPAVVPAVLPKAAVVAVPHAVATSAVNPHISGLGPLLDDSDDDGSYREDHWE